MPTYSVQVAWQQQILGGFTLDVSKLDGTDVLGATFGYTIYDDVTSATKSVSITRGRPTDLATMAQGMCTLRMVDSNGAYNPQNPSSPLNGNLLPMRPVRIQATLSGTTYPLFFGYISRIESNPDPAAQETTIEAVDFFEWLNNAWPTIATQTGQTVDQLITTILNNVGFVEPSMTNIQTGGDLVNTWSDADGSKSCLTLIQNLLVSDLGVFFIDAQGRPTYIPRHTLQAAPSVAATFDGTEMVAILGSVDVKNVINQQAVTRTGGVLQSAFDQTSQNNYGRRDGSPITTPNISTDMVALALASYLVYAQKNPRPPARNTTLRNTPGSGALTQQLARELQDYVTVSDPRGGTSVTGYIVAINHAITAGGKYHTTVYTVQAPVITNAFILDTSTLDSAAVLTY